MGNQTSLTPEQIQEMKLKSNFTEAELQKLFRRFRRLDTDKSGALSVEEFMAIPELENNPLVQRVVSIMDADNNGQIDFKEFITTLSVFSRNDSREEKIKFTFKMYDHNNDGFVSNGDLYRVLKKMVGDNLDNVQLQQLVDRTIMKGDKDMDGKLSYKEFVDMIKNSDVPDKLKIDI